MIDSPYLIEPGSRVDLNKIKTRVSGNFKSKEEGLAAARKNLKKLDQLQDVLYAQGKHALLVVLQAMDAAGKDGTIDFIFSGINPQGCQVTPFKVPTPLEKSHDFLWRIHTAAPPKGMIGIFNRSHYESILVERVHALAPKDVIKDRPDHINNFEKLLADEGVTILKFYLHISKEEQAQRMQARLEDKTKNWKFNPGDLKERELWDDYREAYNDALGKCSTRHAPWYVIPADRKWYRNYVISDIIVRALEGLDLAYPDPIENISQYKIK